MAQHDMNIANQGFPATRADLNNALQALVSNSSGTSAPSTTFANQWWYDTTNNKMYIRNEANNAWIEVFTLDQTNNEWQLTTGVIQAKDSDGLALKTDDGTTRLFIKDSDGNIGLGTTSPTSPLHIVTNDNNTQLTLESTDADSSGGPIMDLHRNSASPNDSDFLGKINFKGENEAGETISYATMYAKLHDSSDSTEDGQFFIESQVSGSLLERIGIYSGVTVLNQDGADIDFRVESDNETHALFVEASEDRVGINNSNPSYTFHVGDTSTENMGIGWMRMESFSVGIPSSGTRWYKIADYATGIMLQGQLFMSAARNGGAHQTNGARIQHGSLAGYNNSVNTGDWGDVGTNYGYASYYIEVGTDDHAYLRVASSIYGGTVYCMFQGRANWTYDGSYVTSAP